MSGEIDLDDMLGPEPGTETIEQEILVDVTPTSRPMGENSRAQLERSRSYPAQPKKNSPERLRRLIEYASDLGAATDAARRAGISYTTLKWWLQKSLEGRAGDGFDVPLDENDESGDGDTVRFHTAWDDAIMVGIGKIEAVSMRRAMGYREALTYQGRVIYRRDPEKVAIARMLGEDEFGFETYALDRYGVPMAETVEKMDPELAMFMLKAHIPKVYGNKAQVDVNVKGGVLVIPMRTVLPEDLNVIEGQYRRELSAPVTFEDSEEDPTT